MSSDEKPSRTAVKKSRGVSRREFGSAALFTSFEGHVTAAQNAFLRGDHREAEREATLALRIRPTAHIFALLAAIAEACGQFDRASDFRLLQAFLARDAILWEELLHEFLDKQLYYKSVVCLQRLSAMENKDPVRYRTLQLQLADLLIGLGDTRRAVNVLLPLWNSSRCRDFEVFALLSSLYFQLGKWASLQLLISESLRHAFPVPASATTATGAGDVAAKTEDGGSAPPRQSRVSKRVRFFGLPDDDDGGGDDNDNAQTSGMSAEVKADGDGGATTSTARAVDSAFDADFDFDELTREDGGGTATPASTTATPIVPSSGTPASAADPHRPVAEGSETVRRFYGTQPIELKTPHARRNFLTLVNVHAELLNECGEHTETIGLVNFAAACLQVPLLDLPPDLLVRLGIAYAFQGDLAQPCREVFHHLLQTCPMDTYADVLFDAAKVLQKVGMHEDAKTVLLTFVRYYEFRAARLAEDLRAFRQALAEAEATAQATPTTLRSLQQRVVDGEAEQAEVHVMLAAAYADEAQCAHSLQQVEEAERLVQRAMELDPLHVPARLLLGRIRFYSRHDVDGAVAVLTPKEGEPALQRIQLGVLLAQVFRASKRYIEAIALGVSIFELIFSSAEDGDAQSVAPGSSRRASAPLLMPTMSRASSAIVPASSLLGMVGGASLAASSVANGGSRLSFSLAASIQSATSVYRQRLERRGRAALTTTVYGASAAASVAAGWTRAEEEARMKDSSSIFRFDRRRPGRGDGGGRRGLDRTRGDGAAEAEAESEGERDAEERRKRRRTEEVVGMRPAEFWSPVKPEPEDGLEGEEKQGEPRAAPVVDEQAETERDLAQLEEYERAHGDAESPTSSYALPSLEEVSRQFGDPDMAERFLRASDHSQHSTAEIAPNPWSPVAPVVSSPAIAPPGAAADVSDHATIREVIAVLGHNRFLSLAVLIVECYSILGKFIEAKEFAFLVLSRCSTRRFGRRLAPTLERALRLAVLQAAVAAGESEDAFRVGMRLLQGDITAAEQQEVLELLHGVLSRGEDRTAILYRAFTEGQCTVPMLVLLANRYHQTRSYTRVLNLYLIALQERPQDIFVNFMVGLTYYLCSHQKKTRSREACVTAGSYYFHQYQHLLISADPRRTGEALYNTARALQFLRLYTMCTPLYERVAYALPVPSTCTVALQRAAKVNLYFIYRWTSGNRPLALAALQRSL